MALSLHDEPTLDETVDRVLEYAMKAVVCAYAGVIFVHKRSQVETVAATDPIVAELDLVQLEFGEGPDLDVLSSPAHSVLVEDTRADERWPQWAEAVAANGVRSMLGIRLYTSSTTIGSLNLYDTRPGHFSEEDRDVAHIFARHAAVALSSARVNDNLWRAIDAGQAFAVMRRYSQDRNLKLHVVAERLIATRRLPE